MKTIFNMKSYFTFLSRNKVYTLINVFGLSVSLMFVILIGAYTWQETNTDKQQSKADRIYNLCYVDDGETHTGSNWNIQSKLMSRYPEIETTCAVNFADLLIKTPLGETETLRSEFVDSTFFDMFDFQLLQGDRHTVLDTPGKAVITEQCARKLFGDANPIGKVITYRDTISITISGIMAPMKNTGIVGGDRKETDILVNFKMWKYLNKDLIETMNNAAGADVYLLLKPGTELRSKLKDMKEYFSTFFWFYQSSGQNKNNIGVDLIRLDKQYFSGIESGDGCHIIGDLKLLKILFGVGLLILLFALINYINLTAAQSGFRSKEMATRRLLGSTRTQIITRLLCESTLLCLLSCLFGILLAFAAAPYASGLLDTTILLSDFLSPLHLLIMVAGIGIIGALAGILPAITMSAAKPIDVVRGTYRRRSRMVLSKIFIILQDTITIVLLACSAVMLFQTRHLIHAPLGYNKDQIMVVGTYQFGKEKSDLFFEQIKKLSCVKNASQCNSTPFDGGDNNTQDINGKRVSFQVILADENFMKLFGITLRRDNKVSDGQPYYVNRQLLSELNLKEDAPTFNYNKNNPPIPIAGVMNDFHIRGIQDGQHPLIVRIIKEEHFTWAGIAIQVMGDPVKAYEEIQKVYKETFNMPLDDPHPYIDQQIQYSYDKELRQSKIVSMFAAIAILISLLGLLAMSTYFIQQYRREIAVRKVFGSTNRQILVRLVRQFLSYSLIAFVISVPIILHFMSRWLSDFSYRIALSPWFYIASGLFCILISFATVITQSYFAANENPINHIKDNQ